MQKHFMIFTFIRRLAVSSFISLLCICSLAQETVDGNVRDGQGEAVVAASVLIYSDSLLTPPMKGYAVTDKNGRFSIGKSDKGDCWLLVRSLGFADCVKHIPDGGSGNIHITLVPDEKSLGEIIVKGTYSGIKVSGDTVKFDTDHFRNGFEGSVGDVLERLPGVSVDEGGSVSYGGKAVGTLLIDGKDMFSRSADGLVVKNMSADAITGAEIIKNYRGSDLSDSFGGSDKTALNIKTKGLGKISGYIDAGGGYENKYNAKSFTLGVGGRYSMTAIVSGNNVGSPVFSISDYISRMASSSQGASGQGGTGFKLSGAEASMLFRPEDLYRDMGNVATFDMKHKVSDKLVIGGNVIVNHSDMSGRRTREETFLSDELTVNDVSESRRHGRLLIADVGADWKPKSGVQLLSDVKMTLSGMNSNADAHSDAEGKTEYSQTDKYANRDFSADVTLNVNAGKGLFYVKANALSAHHTQRFSLLTDTELLPVDYKASDGRLGLCLSDSRTDDDIQVSPTVGYSLDLSKSYNLNAFLSYRFRRNMLDVSTQNAARGEEVLTLREYAATVSLRKKAGIFRFNVGSMVRAENNRFSSRFSNGSIGFYPTARAEYVFAPTGSLSLTLERSCEDIEMSRLSGIPVVNSYNDMTVASRLSTPYRKFSRANLTFSDYNLVSQTYITVFADFRKTRDDVMPHVTQSGNVSTVMYDSDGSSDNLYVRADVEKRFSGLPFSIKANVSFNALKSTSAVNDIPETTRVKAFKSGVVIASDFRSSFNGELTADYSHNRNETDVTAVSSDIDDVKVGGKLMFRSGVWKLKASCEYRMTDSGADRLTFFDAGFMAECRIKAVTLRLSAENFLHLDGAEWLDTFITSYYSAVERYRRMPGRIMLGITLNY